MPASDFSHVIQFCNTLGTPCGISTYTQMLCKAQGHKPVSSLEQLTEVRSPHFHFVHVQHEFALFTLSDLRDIHKTCKEQERKFYITLHTVVPVPSLYRYVFFRCSRFAFKIHRIPGLRKICRKIREQWDRLSPRYNRIPSWHWTFANPDYGWSSYKLFRGQQQFLIQHADKIIVHNEQAKRALEVMGALNVEVVPHGCTRYPVSSALHSNTDDQLHVGCFGFLKPHKNILGIIEACEQLSGVQLHIFASTAHDDQQKEYVRRVLQKAEKHPWIHLNTNFLPIKDIVYQLSQCDVNVWYCDPPGGISASGSICQYLAAKRPIIAMDTVMITDVRDIVHCVSTTDPNELAQALQTYNCDIGRMIHRCRELDWSNVQTHYDDEPQWRKFHTEKRLHRSLQSMQSKEITHPECKEDCIQYQYPEILKNPLSLYDHRYDEGYKACDPRDDTLIFLHIPKSAGTTLTHIVQRNVRSIGFRRDLQKRLNISPHLLLREYQLLSYEQQYHERIKWSQYDVLADHTQYGVHEMLNGSYQYFTMLRNPLDRLISWYRYLQTLPEQTEAGGSTPAVRVRNLNFREFLQNPLFRKKILRNHSAVQIIAGTRDDVITDWHLQRALRHMQSFSTVLIMEEFEASVQLLCRIYNWKDEILKHGAPVPRLGEIIGDVTKSTGASDNLTQQERSLAQELIGPDLELYEHAKAYFSRQAQQYDIVPSKVYATPKTEHASVDLSQKFRSQICVMSDLPADLPNTEFAALIHRHPEYKLNPLHAFQHMHDFGNPNAPEHPSNKLIFLHSQKTGGTTLSAVMRCQYRSIALRYAYQPKNKARISPAKVLEIFRSLPSDVQQKERMKWQLYDAIAGHGIYGLHELFPSDVDYITMLRDPIDRALSYYRYVRRPGLETRKVGRLIQDLSFVEFLQSPLFTARYQKKMSYVRMLSGVDHCVLDDEHVALAKATLDQCAAVLITEEFEQSISLAQKMLGWKNVIWHENHIVPRGYQHIGFVTHSASAREQLSSYEIDLCMEYTRYDREIYEYAQSIFQRQVQEHNLVSKSHVQSTSIQKESYAAQTVDLSKEYRPMINIMSDRPQSDKGVKFEQFIEQHPEYRDNPLRAYEHTYDYGNSAAPEHVGDKLIFLHPQKTGGTTISEMMRCQYRSIGLRYVHQPHAKPRIPPYKILEIFRQLSDEEQEYERSKWDAYDALAGHGVYGLHELFSRPAQYMTLLRDPVDRTLSYYRYTRRPGAEDSQVGRMMRELSFVEFLQSEDFKERYQQKLSYIRMLSGVTKNPLCDENLTKAKHTLDQCETVLISEEFEASIQLLLQVYGWKDLIWYKDKIAQRRDQRIGYVTHSQNARSQLTTHEIDLCMEYTRYDRELYDYARSIFVQHIQRFEIQCALVQASRVSSSHTVPIYR